MIQMHAGCKCYKIYAGQAFGSDQNNSAAFEICRVAVVNS